MSQLSQCSNSTRRVSAAAPAWGLAVLLMLACTGGCSTLSSFGLPLTGPHRLLLTTKQMRKAAGQPVELPRELTKGVLAEYIVEPGDVLVVEAADFNSSVRFANGDQTVKPDGSIDLGKYGSVVAAGKAVAEIQAEVQALVESEEQQPPGPILVRLLAWESKVFYVLGEVNSPGAFPFSGRETVLDAIVAAGDLTDRANRHNVILSRPSAPGSCRMVLPVCYNQIVQLGDTTSNYQMMPGDRVFVTSLTIWEDIVETLFPKHFEQCPRCGAPQVPCFVGTCEGDCPTHAHENRLAADQRVKRDRHKKQ